MNKFSKELSKIVISEKKITWLGLFIIAVFALAQFILNEDHINRDGILYIFQAIALNEGNLNQAILLYPNTTFAKFIVSVHSLLNISYAGAAHAIGFLFFMISCFFYLKILNLLSKDFRLILCGIAVILTSLVLDKYLVMILRDHFLWAGLMGTIYFVINYLNHQRWLYLFLSILTTLFAALFRSEALLLIPLNLFFLLFIQHPQRRKEFLKIFYAIICFILLFSWLSYLEFKGSSVLRIFRLDYIFNLCKDAVFNLIKPLPVFSNDYWLSELIKDHPLLLKVAFFIGMIIYKWIHAVGFIFMFLFWIGINAQTLKISIQVRYFLYCIAFLTLSWPVVNFLSTYVFTSRYLVSHLWILMIFIALGLYQIFFGFVTKKLKYKKYIQWLVVILMFIKFIDIMYDQRNDSHEKLAAQWAKNNQIFKEETYVKNLRFRYYMEWFSITEEAFPFALKNKKYKYFILDHPLSNEEGLTFDMLKSIPNASNSKLFIYKRK